MKDKNLPNNYNSLSLEELTNKANKMIEELESQSNLENSFEQYQDLLKLNKIIEKKFQKDVKNISQKTKDNILEITLKKNAKELNNIAKDTNIFLKNLLKNKKIRIDNSNAIWIIFWW